MALRELGVPAGRHRARPLTPELIERAAAIYCMTRDQREAVIALAPGAAAKTICLDPLGDIPDPIGQPLAAYLSCARRLKLAVHARLEEIGALA